MASVKQLLAKKGGDIYTIGPEATVFEALGILAAKNIGAVPVVQGDKLVGIFSERDYARKVILAGKSSRETKIKDLMTAKVFCVAPDDSVDGCMLLMRDKHIRHLPVLQDGKLIGILTMRDIVNVLIKEKENTIKDLQTYISGGYLTN
jgi:CBS domain-containing protein